MVDITTFSLILIGAGAVTMFISILKYRKTIRAVEDFLLDNNQKYYRLYTIHLILMCFFLFGYGVVLCAIVFNIPIVGNLLTGLIFFFGAVFVYLGIILQTDMLRSIRVRHEHILEQNKHLVQTENVTIFALAYQAEMRDWETGKHLERTSLYVQILTQTLSTNPSFRNILTPKYIADINKAAPLHDIGKVGIPDSILKKPAKLTDQEFNTIKKHCALGANILSTAEKKLDFESFLTVAIKLVLSHHERWDGTGYPQGLRGEEIPLPARIMALADVYDALRSNRYYKKSLSHEKACEIIRNERGKQFDPVITDTFFAIEKEFLRISETMAD